MFEFTGINEVILTGVTLNDNEASNGELRILWLVPIGSDNLSPEDGSVLFEVCFDAIGSNGQSSTLEFVDIPNFAIEIANGSGQTQSLCISQGEAVVGQGDGGGNNGGGDNGGGDNGGGDNGGGNPDGDGVDLCAGSSDFSFITPNISVDAGQNICIPVTTSNFNTIASIQAGISWDSNVLSYTTLNEVSISGISLNESDVATGELKLLWLIGLGDDPVTLDDGSTLFEVCFDAVGSDSESSTINIEDLPGFEVEVASGEGIPLPVCIDNGLIQIGDDVIDPPMPTGDLTVAISSVSNAMTGQQSCVDLDVSNFSDVQSAQFDIEWNTAFMTFNNLMDPEVLNGFGAANQNLTPGNLRISWSPVSAQTLADNTTIFTLCFDVVGSCVGPSSSDVSFVNTATVGIEFTNSNNEVLPVNVESGTVAIDCSMGGVKGSLGPGVITSPECADENTGSIMVSAPTGFIAPVTCTYVREDGSVIRSSTSDCNLISVPAGIYTLTATDAEGDSSTRSYDITAPGAPDISFSTVDATCTVGGSITTQLLGGIVPFEFQWAGGLPPTQNQTDLAPATYQVTITDGNGCTYVRTVPLTGSIETGEALAIGLVNLQDGTCDGGSRIEIQPTGGCSGYSYAWTGPNGETSIEQNLFRIAAGQWTVVVTDQNGATTTESYTVASDVLPIEIMESSIIDPTCEARNSGSIFVDIMGGCGSYLYQWSGPNSFTSNQEDISNLGPGEYTLTTSDINDPGIVATRRFILTLEGNVDFTSEVVDVTNIEGNNGAINIDILDGSADMLSFDWSDGSTEQSREGIAPGEYTLTISDGSDCPTIFFTEVLWPAIFLDSLAVTTPISCTDAEDAVISGEVIGGCEDRVVRVNGVETTFPLMNLAPGTYDVTADDACGTAVNRTIVISDYEAFTVEAVVTCDGMDTNSGVVTLNTSGGSGNFTVESSDGIVDPTDQRIITGLTSGSFNAVISDGCTQMEVSNINVLNCAEDTPTPPTAGLCQGTPIITPNGDNLNETLDFTCVIPGDGVPNQLGIYDRWGRLVFSQDNYDNTWSGTDQDGVLLPEAGYMWVLTQGSGANIVIYRGTVTVLKTGN